MQNSSPPIPNSLWRATAIELANQPPLEEKLKSKVAIIGAGFTGCSAALHLAEKNIEVVVVDAGQPGIGASGRNGGQVNPGIKRTLEAVQQVWGKTLGKSLYNTIGEAPDFVFQLIRKHAIDCHPVRTGIIQPAYSKKSLEYLQRYGEYHASTGAPVEFLDKQRTEELLGSSYYLGGFLDKRAGSVQPLSYCRGLANAAMENGARFFGDSPVSSIDIQGSKKIIMTPKGSVEVDFVFVCTNGYTDLVANDPLIKKLSKTVIPLYSYKVATAALDQSLQKSIIPEQQVIADTRRLLTYFRKDPTGRLVMGGAGGPYEAADLSSYQSIESRIRELYPQIHKPDIEFRWCGKVCVTRDGVPHVHQLKPGVFTALGYNGRGVAMASLMGKWLAEMVAGEPEESGFIPITGLKTIPFHRIRNPFVKFMHYVKDVQDRIER